MKYKDEINMCVLNLYGNNNRAYVKNMLKTAYVGIYGRDGLPATFTYQKIIII